MYMHAATGELNGDDLRRDPLATPPVKNRGHGGGLQIINSYACN
jgi:hypothetical protein